MPAYFLHCESPRTPLFLFNFSTPPISSLTTLPIYIYIRLHHPSPRLPSSTTRRKILNYHGALRSRLSSPFLEEFVDRLTSSLWPVRQTFSSGDREKQERRRVPRELKTLVIIVKRFGVGMERGKGLNFEREAPSNSRCFVEIKGKGG